MDDSLSWDDEALQQQVATLQMLTFLAGTGAVGSANKLSSDTSSAVPRTASVRHEVKKKPASHMKKIRASQVQTTQASKVQKRPASTVKKEPASTVKKGPASGVKQPSSSSRTEVPKYYVPDRPYVPLKCCARDSPRRRGRRVPDLLDD
jgi:hypothetical protein